MPRPRAQDDAQGPPQKLKAGTKLKLGATIVMGLGAAATLRLARPKGVAKTRDLIYVTSAKGTKHTTTLTRKGKRIIVTIVPG